MVDDIYHNISSYQGIVQSKSFQTYCPAIAVLRESLAVEKFVEWIDSIISNLVYE